MKKLGIFALALFLLAGLTACSEKEGEGETTGTETTGTTTGTETGATTTGTGTEMPDNNATATGEEMPDLPATTVEFYEDTHNFGEIKEGEKVSHVFKFKNTGENDLVLQNVKPSCGCTTPDWSKDPVAPGEEGFVKVEFDSKAKNGMQKKSVTVVANTTPKAKILTFSGEVVSE